MRTLDNFQIILIQNVLINTVKCQDEFLVQCFCSLPHFLLINNLLQQILSLHILQFITAHFTFITAQIGYHCTLKLGMLTVTLTKLIPKIQKETNFRKSLA